MCIKPNTFNGYEVSCRECDQCVATYKNSWVARSVAELQTNPYALAFTLTYADVDGQSPLGARVVRYKDVQDMWRRIRKAGKKRWGKDFRVRYVIVAEKGTKFLRVHYHGVMFSNYPVQLLGTISSSTKRDNAFTYKARLHWSMWAKNGKPIGFVEFQPADRRGISYVLKYILKSRMTAARSEGFKREGKTEYMASSQLFCSKVPGIGSEWLFAKVADMFSKNMCPFSLRVTVPGGGDWYVMGETQKRLMLEIREANAVYNDRTGRNLAGYNVLLKSVEKDMKLSTGEVVKRKAWEYLVNGDPLQLLEEEEEYGEITDEDIYNGQQYYDFQERYDLAAELLSTRRRAKKCYGLEACAACRGKPTARQESDNAWYKEQWLSEYQQEKDKHRFEYTKFPDFEEWIIRQGNIASGCRHKAQYGSIAEKEGRRFREASKRYSYLQRTAR